MNNVSSDVLQRFQRTSCSVKSAIAIGRLLTQALSNIVTGRDDLMDQLWETYLNLSEDQVVIMCVMC